MTTRINSRVLRNIGFGAVLLIALALSGWSIYGLAVLLHIPLWLAVIASVAYDGAALYLGVLSIEYARSEDSSATAKFFAYLFIFLSALLNATHANLLGLGWIGVLFYGTPSVTAGILFEEFLKFENKTELRKRGRVLPAMPLFAVKFWLLHPIKSYKKYDSILLQRLNSIEEFTAETAQFTSEPSRELPLTRVCKKCGVSKLLENFRRYSKGAENYTSRTCVECETAN